MLLDKLKFLSKHYDIIGMKQSFEDEGVSLSDLIIARRLTDLCNLKCFVKIGGCEAKTDCNNCFKIGVDAVVGPMIESEFAVSKFLNATFQYSFERYILIESKTGFENIESILSAGFKNKLSGIIVGRSDFSKSYSLNKSEVDSDFIFDKVKIILSKSKKYDLCTTLGGNISIKSVNFIKEMFFESLLNRVETRNVVISLNNDNINQINEVIMEVLNFEIEWTKYKKNFLIDMINDYDCRINTLTKREE